MERERITVAWLERHRAPSSCYQVEIFAREWPDGAELTVANILRAAELHLDLLWLAGNILPDAAYEEYMKASVLVLAKCEKARTKAFREYIITNNEAAWEKYKKAMAEAWAECNKARTRMFISALEL